MRSCLPISIGSLIFFSQVFKWSHCSCDTHSTTQQQQQQKGEPVKPSLKYAQNRNWNSFHGFLRGSIYSNTESGMHVSQNKWILFCCNLYRGVVQFRNALFAWLVVYWLVMMAQTTMSTTLVMESDVIYLLVRGHTVGHCICMQTSAVQRSQHASGELDCTALHWVGWMTSHLNHTRTRAIELLSNEQFVRVNTTTKTRLNGNGHTHTCPVQWAPVNGQGNGSASLLTLHSNCVRSFARSSVR